MSWQISLLLISCALFGLLMIGEWIVFALGIAGMLFLLICGGSSALGPIGSIVWESASNYTLTSIPLFILMGELILQSRIGERFYLGMSMIFRRVPGGLLHTNIISCGIFSALTGVSVATAATIGTVAIPELTKQGYDRKMIFGSLAAGGTLGILIPPSIPFILYGVLAQQSVAKLFAAGILPGIMMVALFVVYIGVRVFFNPNLVGGPSTTDQVRFSLSTFCLSVLPIICLISVCVGGIYLGIMTPTEAAAVGAVLAMVLYLWCVGFDSLAMKAVISNTVRTSCMVLFIAVGAQIFSFAMVYSDLNQMLTGWVVSHGTTPGVVFVLMIGIYIVLGCFLDPISVIVLSMGVLYPIIVQYNFDPIWFGVNLVIMVELGLITPPVGLNLFVIHGISGRRPMGEIISGAFPYCFILLFGVLLLYIFPGIALFLPNSMR
jgi:C4-dicarboxylate transporter, DctM subunit